MATQSQHPARQMAEQLREAQGPRRRDQRADIPALAPRHEGIALLRLAEVRRRTGLSRSAIYQGGADSTFPRAIRLGKSRSVAWVSSEIDAWIAAQLVAARNAS